VSSSQRSFALTLVMHNKFYLDDFYSAAVKNNTMFRTELKPQRDELRLLINDINRKFAEYSEFNSDTQRTGWTIEKMTEFCADCHAARTKIFEYMGEINTLIGAQIRNF
jgi:hypothetical protein